MTKFSSSCILILFLSLTSFSQDEKPSYIGLNILPMIGNTVELGYEINPKPNVTFDIYGGYTFNSKLNGLCTKEYTGLDITHKSGGFIKIGARYNFRKSLNKIAPFIGVNMVNAISHEKGTQEYWSVNDADQTTSYKEDLDLKKYNLGVCGVLGITGNATNRLNFDVEIQVGGLFENNLLGCNSYMPGMGASLLPSRVQGILRVKYRIN